jgi:hypothetical protein
VIEHLYDHEMSSISTQRETRMAHIAGQLNMLNAELVTLIAGAINDHSWSGHGIHTPAQWLTIQLGASSSHAKQLVETATHATSFPIIIGEFTAGRISLDQTHVIVTKAPAWADPKLVNTATSATVPQLHRMIRNDYFEGPDTPNPDTTADALPDPPAPPTAAAAPAVAPDRVSFGWNGSRLTGTFDLAADTGAILQAALNEARDALYHDGLTDLTWADALTEIALRSLDHTTSPIRRTQFKTMLHIGVDDERGTARFSNGVPLPTAIRDYLTCDTNCQAVWETDHTPIGVGRTQRSVPTRLRNLITHRDQGCQIPGCTATHTQIHHIIHWTNGGTTNPENLISICARHHRAHHLGQIGIQGNANQPDTMIFTDQHGNPINTTPQPIITPPTPASPQPVYEHPSGERLNLTHFAGWNHPTVQHRHNTTWHQHQQRTRLTETTDEDHHAA